MSSAVADDVDLVGVSRSNGALRGSKCCANALLPANAGELSPSRRRFASRQRSRSRPPPMEGGASSLLQRRPKPTAGDEGRKAMTMIDDTLAAIDADAGPALERLFDFLRIPSVSARARPFPRLRAGGGLAGRRTRRDRLRGRQASDRRAGRWSSATSKAARRDAPHVLFYGHYDVQPADPLDLWRSPPFEPKLEPGPRGERIVARGASDDKGQLMTFLEACRAFQKFGGPPCRSPCCSKARRRPARRRCPPSSRKNAKTLKADVALVCDTGMWDATTPAITTALRGIVADEVILTGANRDLHSGLYGGVAVNPIHVLARILGELHDDNGAVALPGFYDGVEELPGGDPRAMGGARFRRRRPFSATSA